jgi:hypothetical protein
VRISLASEPAKNVGSDMCGRHFPKKSLEETAGKEEIYGKR